MKSTIHHADTAGRIALGPTKLPATPVAFAQDVAEALGLSKSHPGTARLATAIDAAPTTTVDTTPATDGGGKSNTLSSDEIAAHVIAMAMATDGIGRCHVQCHWYSNDASVWDVFVRGEESGPIGLGTHADAHTALRLALSDFERLTTKPVQTDDGSPSMLAEQDAQSARTLAATMAREGGAA